MSEKALIIVPMKDLERCKSRLRKNLSQPMRQELAIHLFLQTLRRLRIATKKLTRPFDIFVLTESEDVRAICDWQAVKTITFKNGKSLSQYLNLAAEWAANRDYKSMCIVPADLADPSIDDLVKLISHPTGDNCVLLCPAKDLGTNALVASPPNAIKFSYGRKSFLSHMKLAVLNDVHSVILPLESLKLDIDVHGDLRVFLDKYPSFFEVGALK